MNEFARFAIDSENFHEAGGIIGNGKTRQKRAAQIGPWRPLTISRPAPAMAKFPVAIQPEKLQLTVRTFADVRPGQASVIYPMHIDGH